MPDLDVDSFYDADSSDNEENHSNLLNSIFQLDSTQKVKPARRKEISSEISEFNLSSGPSLKKKLINVKELVQVLGQKSKHGVINKKLKSVTCNSKVLPKPLEKPVEEKLKRSIGFENVKKQLQRWNAIVARNALKDQIIFPLNDNSTQMHKSNEFLSQFRTLTHLEEEIARVLKQKKTEEKEAENDEFPLTLREMMEKRKEMAQLRAKLSYKQTKAQRQNKIKSKKYHRLQKREKLKQQLKEFETLQKSDPEAALKKLSELDKTRAIERASLRHRNTGHWAKNLAVRAKYDVETRKVLAEQLKLSRELTQKISNIDCSEDEEPVETVVLNNTPLTQDVSSISSDNPWIINVSKEVEDFVSGYKKFWAEKEKEINLNLFNEKENREKMEQKEENREKMEQKEENREKMEQKEENREKIEQKEENREKIEQEEKNREKIEQKEENREKMEQKEESREKKEQKGKNSKKNERIEINQIKFNKGETDTEISKNNLLAVEKESDVINNRRSNTVIRKDEVLNGDEKLQKPPKMKILPADNFNKNVKVSYNKVKEYIMVHPASGVWKVTTSINKFDSSNKNKRKINDIDTLFDELNDKLIEKATKKVKKMKKKLKKCEKIKESNDATEVNTEFDLSLKSKNVIERPELDVGLLEGTTEDQNFEINLVNDVAYNCKNEQESAAIDPKKFIQVKPKRLRTHLPENIDGEEKSLDDEKAQQMFIEEAFGEDDVMAEFKEMKEEENNNKVEIETSLPGWGKWGGTGIVPKPRKKRLLVLNLPPRKDKLKKDVIINENENPNLRSHLVKEVPHPFKSVDAFEANIRAPVGRDWVPETAHQKLIQKQVVTKLGAIIEPMDENEIVRFKKASKSPYQGLKKEKT